MCEREKEKGWERERDREKREREKGWEREMRYLDDKVRIRNKGCLEEDQNRG